MEKIVRIICLVYSLFGVYTTVALMVDYGRNFNTWQLGILWFSLTFYVLLLVITCINMVKAQRNKNS